MTTRTIKHPKALLDFLFADPAGCAGRPTEREFDFAGLLAAKFDRLREIARATIRKSRLDPLHCRTIARERKAADSVFWAAQMLTELDRIQDFLARVEQSELEEALGSILNALAFAGLYHSFAAADGAPNTAAEFGVRPGAAKGRSAKEDNHASVARRMAEEFQKRQRARDLAAGAMVGAPRPSDTELKRQIGAKYGFGKSAAVHAIDYGLTILNATAASRRKMTG